jgi:hypothetical protein
MLRAIIDRPAIPAANYLIPVAVTILPLWIYELFQYMNDDLELVARTPWYVRGLFYTSCFYAIILAGEFGGQQFIYFQF